LSSCRRHVLLARDALLRLEPDVRLAPELRLELAARPGVNVMRTNFGDFVNFSAEKWRFP
jgi:hypothetical protein